MTIGLRLDAVVLAAGAGKRFGGGKLTSPWGDLGMLVEGALSAAFASPARTVTVTVGADPRVAEAAQTYAIERGEPERLAIVLAAGWEGGVAASLRAAVLAAPEDCEGLFVFLGDMPRIPHAVAETMAWALEKGAVAVAPVFHGRRGHPVLFGQGLFSELLDLEGDRGGGGLLDALGEALVTIPAPDDGVLFDVDVPGLG